MKTIVSQYFSNIVIGSAENINLAALVMHSLDVGSHSGVPIDLIKRLNEVKALFREWLALHMPLRKNHIMSMINDIREGSDYDASFHRRMRGSGVFASMISKRFKHACKLHGLNQERRQLACDIFRVPQLPGTQQKLF